MKKILVAYYTQTGQILDICKSIFSEVSENKEIEITYKEILPAKPYPFPWPVKEFFDVFPESVGQIPCELNNSNFITENNFDLIIIAGQVWYLSASIPVHSFLQSPEAKQIIKNKPVITVYGVRNMWVNAHKQNKNSIKNAGGNLVGNIVLADSHNNLVSVITIVRWLINGRKKAEGIWPAAGVTEKDIETAKIYGNIIAENLLNNNFADLQTKPNKKNAVKIDYAVMKTELNGYRIFNIWYNKILKKGNITAECRNKRLKMFKNYLYFVIFAVSPFASLVFKIKKLIFPKLAKKEIEKHTSLQ